MMQPARYAPPAAPAATAPDYQDMLPPWLNYLIAAYPTAKLASRTLPVFEDAFSDEEPDVMREAVRAAVNDLRFFPTVYELRQYVRAANERRDDGNWKLPPHLFYRWASRNWPVCEQCGERVPDPANCPACADLARSQ